MKRRVTMMAAAALMLVGGSALAATNLERAYGTPEIGLSARSRGMGGAGAALEGGVFSLVDNPAALALAKGTRLEIVAGVGRVSENRFVPLFDTFDSYVDETAIAVNDNLYGTANGGALYERGWVVAAGVFQRFDPRYDYYDERRSTATTDQLLAERFIRTTGVINSFTIGGAVPFGIRGAERYFTRGAVGASVNWYYGNLEDRDALVPHATTVSGYVETLNRSLTGLSLTVGGTVEVSERVRAALAWETGPLLTNEFSASIDDSVISTPPLSRGLHLPPRVQGGIAYRPRNTMLTTFAMDVIWMPWSWIHDEMAPGQELLDTWDVRFGLEHVYYNRLPGRIGFRYQRSYEMREADRVTFTLGGGYQVDRFALDLSTELGKRVSRQEPVWPRDEQGPAVGAGMDRVEDTVLRFYLGTQVRF